eukprot:gene1952-2130_t
MAEEQVEAVDAMDRAMALAGQRLDRVAHLTHQVISQHSSLDLLKLILSEKVVADTSSYLNYFVQTKHGLEPALSAAVVGQNPAIIRRLLQEGVDVNIVNAQGYTSLIHAALLGDEATVRLLLEVGADPSLYFAHRMKIVTPLGAAMRHCAKPSQSRHTNMMRHILMSGANLQTTLEEESEAMEALIEHGHIWAALENMAVEKEDKLEINLFTGTLPEALADMKSLEQINIFQNSFHGTLPAALFSSKNNLSSLYIYQNLLTGSLAQDWGGSTNLAVFAAAINSFHGEIPLQLYRLPKLLVLVLGDNLLSGTISSQLSEAPVMVLFVIQLNDGIDWQELIAKWTDRMPSDFSIWLVNRFGDFVVVLGDESVHYMDFQLNELDPIADSKEDFFAKIEDQDNANDWLMMSLVDACVAEGKVLSPGKCYHFTIPTVLGGNYDVGNVAAVSMKEHFDFLADLHEKIESLPDGTPLKLQVIS